MEGQVSMKRDEYQEKFILDDEAKETIYHALLYANEHTRAMGQVARALGDMVVAEACAAKARKFQELLTYAPEVVRVAVTVEYPVFESSL